MIALGIKKVETRCWTTSYRGPLLIHAAKHWGLEQTIFCHELPNRARWLRAAGYGESWRESLPRGEAVAVVNLLDVQPVERFELTKQEQSLGDYRPGCFGWLIGEIRRPMWPKLMKGRQRLWSVDVVSGEFGEEGSG